MDTLPKTAQGRFVWFDLMTRDKARAVAFYRAVTGWGTEDWSGSEDTPYTMWTAGEQPIGGVVEDTSSDGPPPHWIAYIECDDLDDTVERAQQLGASLLVPIEEVASVGRMAFLTDPTGASFALYEPDEPSSPEDPTPAEGHFSWHELATEDLEGAKRFYTELLGWTETDVHDMGEEMGPYWMFGRGAQELGGMYRKPDAMPGPSAWMHYVSVADINTAVSAVETHGGAVLNGPMEVPGGDFIAQCTDPDGAAFALHAVASGGDGAS